MIKEYTKQTIIICFLLQGIALSSRAQEQQVWQRYYDKCRREANDYSLFGVLFYHDNCMFIYWTNKSSNDCNSNT